MNKLLRALIAGWGAKKLGGGCLSTILVFLVIYWALGTCNSKTNRNDVPAGRTTMIRHYEHVPKTLVAPLTKL